MLWVLAVQSWGSFGVESFGPYDIKGKGATDMWLAGVPITVIPVLCGHASAQTTECYALKVARRASRSRTQRHSKMEDIRQLPKILDSAYFLST